MAGTALLVGVLGLFQVYSATFNTKFHSAFSQHVVWLLFAVRRLRGRLRTSTIATWSRSRR